MSPYDPRAIANLMLDEADYDGIEITNLALQKLLYFLHGLFLVQNKSPLITGHFEAWEYGPVHPAVYRAFKSAGSQPIKGRAQRKDPLTGSMSSLPEITDRTVINLIRHVLRSFGTMSPGRLVDLSHATGSPWHYVVDKSRTSVAFGLRIEDDVILERFKNHKVSVGLTPHSGEPVEDTPFT